MKKWIFPAIIGIGTAIAADVMGYPVNTVQYWVIFAVGMGGYVLGVLRGHDV